MQRNGAQVKVEVRNRLEIDQTYRVARALGLFNVSSQMAAEFCMDVEVPIDSSGAPEGEWRIGVVCGPSGSGKTSIGRALEGVGWTEWGAEPWGPGAIIDEIDPNGSFDQVTAVLASVGLGTVPSWIRPFRVLSNGERYRAELARLLAERPTRVFFDEFTSVLDRKVAKVGAQAFAKAWRRGPANQVVFLTPHRDVLDWLKPDWVIYTSLQAAASDDPKTLVSNRDSFDSPAVTEVIA